MPELPEIVTLARNMQQELAGRTITGVEVLRPKCLNLPEGDFVSAVQGARILRAPSHGRGSRPSWMICGQRNTQLLPLVE